MWKFYLIDIENVSKKNIDDYIIFKKYYKKAVKTVKNMSLKEKVGQLFLVRYNKGINNSHITADKVLRGQLIKGRRLCVWVEENIEQIRKILK